MDAKPLEAAIDAAWEARDTVGPATRGAARDAVEAALAGLDSGELRVAEKIDGRWQTAPCPIAWSAARPSSRPASC